jgi:hypothetical protein
MSEAWADSVESESYDALGEGAYDSEALGEGAYDSEAVGEGSYEGYGEESRSARRRRERQRQIMLARQRQAELRRRQPPARVARPARPAGPPPRQTITAIRSLDLETKVSLDSLRRTLEESNRRAARATWAAVAGAAVDQGIDSFNTDLGGHEYVKAGARFAPLLFLSPEKTRSGVEGFVTDPRVIGGAAILGIALLGTWRTKSATTARVSIVSPPGTVTAPPAAGIAAPLSFNAQALDRNGNPVSPQPTFAWTSDTPSVLSPASTSDGNFAVQPGSKGKVTITVWAAGFSDQVKVRVTAS